MPTIDYDAEVASVTLTVGEWKKIYSLATQANEERGGGLPGFEPIHKIWTQGVVIPVQEAADLRAGQPRVCPDYPAPCNCDDPTTHNGH